MAEREFVIRIVNDAISKALAQIGQVDKKMSDMSKRYKATIAEMQNQEKKFSETDVNNTKSTEQKKVAIRKAALNKTIADEKERYSRSEQLALQLQNTLRSVFERAVFYTAVYKGISLVTQAFREWIDVNIELDYALAKVNTISQITASQMERLTNLSVDTGRSLVDISNALYEINSAGITGSKAMSVLEVSTRAAVGGFVDARNAADTLTDVLNAYHLSVNQTEIVSDKLLKTVELGKLKWEEYQGVLGRVLPQAYNLGISLDELLGSLGTLTLSGLKFREAAVGMRNIMIKLQKPTKGMDKALIQLNANLGETFGSIQDVIKAKGLIPTIQLLGDVLDSTDLETVDLFNNVRGLTAQLSLMSDAGEKATQITAKIGDSAGTTQEKMEIMSKTIEEAQNRLKTAWEALGKDLFTFNSSIIGLTDAASQVLLKIKDYYPVLIGLGSAMATLTAGAALLGVKFITLKTIVPLVAGLFATSVPPANALSTALAGVGLQTQFVAKSMWTLNAAIGIVTVTAAAFLATYTAVTAWQEKNRKEAKLVVENTNNMIKAFKDASKEADILSKARPFESMTNPEITKQIQENNRLLREREVILANIKKIQDSGKDYVVDEEGNVILLKEQETALFMIEGYNKKNLAAMEAMSREQDYRTARLTREQVLIAEITGGYAENLGTREAAAGVELAQLRKITDELKNQIKLSEETRDNFLGILPTENAFKQRIDRLTELLNVFDAERKEKESQLRSAELEKSEKEQLDIIRKYRDLRLKESLAGRIFLLEEEKKAEEERARFANVSEEYILDITKHYDDLIFAEREKIRKLNKDANEKHYEDMSKQIQENLDFQLKQYEDFQKKFHDKLKADFDFRKKTMFQYLTLKEKYYNTDVQNAINARDQELEEFKANRDAYKKEFIKTEEDIAKFDAETKLIQENIELEHGRKITEIKYAEWQKQYEFQADLLGSLQGIYEESLNIMILSTESAMVKLKQVWSNIYTTIIKFLTKMIAKLAVVATLKAFIAGAKFDSSWFNGLMGMLNLVEGKSYQDAIIKDDVIHPFRKDDVVAIGTNLYGTRSGGTGSGVIESKLDKLINAVNIGNLITKNQKLAVQGVYLTPEGMYAMAEQGKKKTREV